MSVRLMPNSQSRNTSSLPAANRPPTSAPLDEPATATMSSERACSASITPICASPRAPPAPSTSATLLAAGDPRGFGAGHQRS